MWTIFLIEFRPCHRLLLNYKLSCEIHIILIIQWIYSSYLASFPVLFLSCLHELIWLPRYSSRIRGTWWGSSIIPTITLDSWCIRRVIHFTDYTHISSLILISKLPSYWTSSRNWCLLGWLAILLIERTRILIVLSNIHFIGFRDGNEGFRTMSWRSG